MIRSFCRVFYACLGLMCGSVVLGAQTQGVIIEKVIVRVNGEIFTLSQLTERQIDALRDNNRDVADPKALQDDASLRALVAKVTPDVIVNAVDELLLVQRAKEMNLKYTDEQFKSSVDKIKQGQNLDDAKFQEALKQEGVTIDELRTRLEHAYLQNQVLMEEFGQRTGVTEAEERQFYNAHQSLFMTASTVTVRELFIAVPTRTQNGRDVFSVADESAGRAKIDAALAKAAAGDFAAVVAEVSESATKANGGIIGPIEVGDLNPALKDILDKLQPGSVTEPIRTPRGWQAFKLEARNVPELQPFEKIRDQIEQQMRSERVDVERDKLLARLRTQALIEWKDDDLRQIYEKKIREIPVTPETPAK